MKENKRHFWHTVLYYPKKGENATECKKKCKKNCAVHGEGAMTDRKYHK